MVTYGYPRKTDKQMGQADRPAVLQTEGRNKASGSAQLYKLRSTCVFFDTLSSSMSKMIFRVSLCLLLCVAVRSQSDCDPKQNENWSYSGSNGPAFWGDRYAMCRTGQRQSPIDIKIEATVPNSSPEDGQISTFGYTIPIRGKIENDGHTVEVTPQDDVERGVEIGGVTYNLRQFHFHFGSGDFNGTEHTIDGQGYAMEMHLVHMNSDSEIAVIGIMFRVKGMQNRNLKNIVKTLSVIQNKGDETEVSDVRIDKLFPKCIQPVYFTYSGSLTTPACAEGVKWFVVNGVTNISREQMRRFRRLSSVEEGSCPLADNVRPIQDLNNRQVTAYSGDCFTH